MLGAAAIGLAGAVRGASAQQTTPIATGDCTLEPGVQLLIDWRYGKTIIPHEQLVAPVDWQIVSSTANTLVLQIPPDWEMQVGWAVSISETGVPEWVTSPPQVPM